MRKRPAGHRRARAIRSACAPYGAARNAAAPARTLANRIAIRSQAELLRRCARGLGGWRQEPTDGDSWAGVGIVRHVQVRYDQPARWWPPPAAIRAGAGTAARTGRSRLVYCATAWPMHLGVGRRTGRMPLAVSPPRTVVRWTSAGRSARADVRGAPGGRTTAVAQRGGAQPSPLGFLEAAGIGWRWPDTCQWDGPHHHAASQLEADQRTVAVDSSRALKSQLTPVAREWADEALGARRHTSCSPRWSAGRGDRWSAATVALGCR